MPEKNEQITADLQILKVDDNPRTFGDNGKAWGIVTEESVIPGREKQFKLEVYSEDGAKAARTLKGQGPKTLTLAFSGYYQDTENWKLVKAPGFEAGKGGGGRGQGMSPEAVGRMIAQSAIQAAASVSKPGADAQDVCVTADFFVDYILTTGKAIVPRLGGSNSAASPNGQGAKEELESLQAALLERFKESDSEASEKDVEHALFAWAKENKIGWPIEGSKIAPAIAWLKEQLAGSSAE